MSTPATPYRQLILAEVLARLQTIRRPNGFETDAGRYVLIGEIAIGPDDADEAIAMVPGETSPLSDRTIGKVAEVLPIGIAALARVRSYTEYARAWMRAEAILADIKQALEIADRTYGGLIQNDLRRGPTVTLERPEGGDTLGIGITYEAWYHTGWGIR